MSCLTIVVVVLVVVVVDVVVVPGGVAPEGAAIGGGVAAALAILGAAGGGACGLCQPPGGGRTGEARAGGGGDNDSVSESPLLLSTLRGASSKPVPNVGVRGVASGCVRPVAACGSAEVADREVIQLLSARATTRRAPRPRLTGLPSQSALLRATLPANVPGVDHFVQHILKKACQLYGDQPDTRRMKRRARARALGCLLPQATGHKRQRGTRAHARLRVAILASSPSNARARSC